MNEFNEKLAENYAILAHALEKQYAGLDYAVREFSKKVRDGPIFDLGCGSGIATKKLVDTLDEHIVGIDVDPNMLAKAEEKTTAEFVEADMLYSLPLLKADSVGGVFTSMTLHNFPVAHREKLVADIYRILKPGGIFGTYDKMADTLDEAIQEVETHVPDYVKTLVEGGHLDLATEMVTHDLRDLRSDRFLTTSAMGSLLVWNGFKDIKEYELRDAPCARYIQAVK